MSATRQPKAPRPSARRGTRLDLPRTRTPLDAAARERLSTVYYPGGKITMLPDAVSYTHSEPTRR